MAMKNSDAEKELLEAKVIEQMQKADRGEILVSEFLTPREMYFVSSVLNRAGYRGRFAFCGGCEAAERTRLVCLPEYALYGIDETDEAAVSQIASEFVKDEISTLLIRGSGFRSLSHRDFMGALLALGIKRGCIGDILVDGDEAYVFCDVKMSGFIKETLTKVGRDSVKVTSATLPENFAAIKRTVTVTDTVASMRADSVIAALVNCSREKAKEYVLSGLCELNYEQLLKPDAAVDDGDVLSVRGKGKFIIKGTDGKTKRGRLRLWAEKYV